MFQDKAGKGESQWVPWVLKGSAAANLAAVSLMLIFLVQLGKGSIAQRMSYIVTHETAVVWSWGSGLVATAAMTFTFYILMRILDQRYRAILLMALMIWLIGASAGVMHDLIQMTWMPALSRLFLEVPTQQLAGYISAWENLLHSLISVFTISCYAISGLIYTGVMFRTAQFPDRLALWSLVIWTVILVTAVSVRWFEMFLPWMMAISLLLLAPWVWELGRVIPKSRDT